MDFRSSDEVFLYFESFTNLERSMSFTEREYRLDRMHFLLDLFNNPQNDLKIIHVAGSKGKGSTASAAASILSSLGYKTGLYTSPHLISYKERVTHAGIFIGESELIKTGSAIKDKIEKEDIPFPDPPTTFELLTLYAFLLFRETKCEWAVMETGIGGRLDATNAAVPEASVITPVEMEHSDILGDTIDKIASEKCGIIKAGIPVFVSPQKSKVLEIIKKTAVARSSPLYLLENSIGLENISINRSGTEFSIAADNKSWNICINLPGRFQAFNSALALLTVKTVLNIPWEKAAESLKYIPLKGRIEIIRRESSSDIVIDSSHTPDSALMFAETLNKIYQNKGILIFGSVEGKDYRKIAENILSCFDIVIVSRPGTFKKSSPEKIYRDLKMTFPEKNIIIETEAGKALAAAEYYSKGEKHIAVTGSFYMASEIKKLLTGEN